MTFLFFHLSDEAPENGENFECIFEDFDKHIMPGIVHWNHPSFFAYFPSGSSYPSLLGDMLSSATNQIGFNWVRNYRYETVNE